MYSVAAPIWNQVARTQALASPLGKALFPLDQPHLTDELNRREAELAAQGIEPRVASAYLAVAPLLAENQALSRYVAANPQHLGTFPNVVNPSEAVALATQEYSLTPSQQATLQTLLTKPPT